MLKVFRRTCEKSVEWQTVLVLRFCIPCDGTCFIIMTVLFYLFLSETFFTVLLLNFNWWESYPPYNLAN